MEHTTTIIRESVQGTRVVATKKRYTTSTGEISCAELLYVLQNHVKPSNEYVISDI